MQLVRLERGGDPVDVLPDGFGARTRVHEYGGGAWLVRDGTVVFVATGRTSASTASPRVHAGRPRRRAPQPLTPEPGAPAALRYADGAFTPDGAWSSACGSATRSARRGTVRRPTAADVVNEIVAVPADGSAAGRPEAVAVLATGRDFVAAPRVSRDGRMLAWLTWDHPAHAVGRHRAVDRPAGRVRADDGRAHRGGGAAPGGRRPRRVAGPAGVGSPRPALRGLRPRRLVERLPGRGPRHARSRSRSCGPRSASRPGSSASPATASPPTAPSCAPTPRAARRSCSSSRPTGARCATKPLPYTSLGSVQVSRGADGREEVTFVAASGLHEPVVARVELPAPGVGPARPAAGGAPPPPRPGPAAGAHRRCAEPITFPTAGGGARRTPTTTRRPTRTSRRPTASCPRCWCSPTAGPTSAASPALLASACSSGRAGASPWSTSTTAAPPATAAPTGGASTAAGASSTWRTASRPPRGWSSGAWPTPTGWPSGAARPAGSPRSPR